MNLLNLARHMGVTASTMSLAISRLARQGYVRRAREGRDRRYVNLRLTPAGARVREAKSVLDPERVANLLAELSAADRRDALHGLELLARAADAAMAQQAARRTAAKRRN